MSRKAFTLVELLVVIIILGLISYIGFPSLMKVITNEHFTELIPENKYITNIEETTAAVSETKAAETRTAETKEAEKKVEAVIEVK